MDVGKPRKRSKKAKALKRFLPDKDHNDIGMDINDAGVGDKVHDNIDMDIDDAEGGHDMPFEDLWHSAVPASEFDQDEDVEDMVEEMERAAVKKDLEQDSELDSSGSDCD